MNSRLKQFLAAENITQAQFADTINVVRASVSHILAGRNNPSYDFIRAMMEHYPKLNMEWLMFGRGKMYKDTPASASEQLFPEEAAPLPVVVSSIPVHENPVAEIPETMPSIAESKTLDKTVQPIVKQRKVLRIIVMFDDGTYQEM